MRVTVRRYLAALGLGVESPSAEYLRRIHVAHAARFAHDTLWMVRHRVPPLDAPTMVEALLDGEGGACMQLNVGLWWLLHELGFQVRLHSATAQATFQLESSRHHGDHCVLTVELPEGRFLADCGTGTGHSAPLPLAPGEHVQGGLRYRVTEREVGLWRIEHDRRTRALRAVELRLDEAELSSFDPLYHELATAPDSPYRSVLWAQRRTPDTVEMLHLRTLRVRRATGWEVHQLESAQEWERELRHRFHLDLPGWTEEERDRLWALTDGAAGEGSAPAAATPPGS